MTGVLLLFVNISERYGQGIKGSDICTFSSAGLNKHSTLYRNKLARRVTMRTLSMFTINIIAATITALALPQPVLDSWDR